MNGHPQAGRAADSRVAARISGKLGRRTRSLWNGTLTLLAALRDLSVLAERHVERVHQSIAYGVVGRIPFWI